MILNVLRIAVTGCRDHVLGEEGLGSLGEYRFPFQLPAFGFAAQLDIPIFVEFLGMNRRIRIRSHVRGQPTTIFNGWPKAKTALDKKLEGVAPYTLHDLRRTFSSQLAALGTPIHVTEKFLNHVSGTLSGVAAVYNRYSYAEEMSTAMVNHEQHLQRLTGLNERAAV